VCRAAPADVCRGRRPGLAGRPTAHLSRRAAALHSERRAAGLRPLVGTIGREAGRQGARVLILDEPHQAAMHPSTRIYKRRPPAQQHRLRLHTPPASAFHALRRLSQQRLGAVRMPLRQLGHWHAPTMRLHHGHWRPLQNECPLRVRAQWAPRPLLSAFSFQLQNLES
jgi:hypothetical protein